MEFLRRFVQHILPRGFVRIRQSGFLANTHRTSRVALARTVQATSSPPAPVPLATGSTTTETDTRAMWRRHDRGSDSYRGPARGLGAPRLVMTARSPWRSESDQMCQTHIRISVYVCASSRPPRLSARAHSHQVEIIPPSTARHPRVADRSLCHQSSCL
jgi:hypothetical protein